MYDEKQTYAISIFMLIVIIGLSILNCYCKLSQPSTRRRGERQPLLPRHTVDIDDARCPTSVPMATMKPMKKVTFDLTDTESVIQDTNKTTNISEEAVESRLEICAIKQLI